MHMFDYKWYGKELRVGPLSGGTMATRGKVMQINKGGGGGSFGPAFNRSFEKEDRRKP